MDDFFLTEVLGSQPIGLQLPFYPWVEHLLTDLLQKVKHLILQFYLLPFLLCVFFHLIILLTHRAHLKVQKVRLNDIDFNPRELCHNQLCQVNQIVLLNSRVRSDSVPDSSRKHFRCEALSRFVELYWVRGCGLGGLGKWV